jgi:hypothetical protein
MFRLLRFPPLGLFHRPATKTSRLGGMRLPGERWTQVSGGGWISPQSNFEASREGDCCICHEFSDPLWTDRPSIGERWQWPSAKTMTTTAIRNCGDVSWSVDGVNSNIPDCVVAP